MLRFVNDVLASSAPQFASDLLGFPRQDARREGDLLDGIVNTLSVSRFAMTQPGVYRDALQTLYQLSHHKHFAQELNRVIEEGGQLCQSLFRAAITANDMTYDVEQRTQSVSYWSYRANVYGVLSRCLENIDGHSDPHRNVLLQIFTSFFPENAASAMLHDLERLQSAMQSGFETEAEIHEVQRLAMAMALFVKNSIVKHSALFHSSCRHALGVFHGLASIALQVNAACVMPKDTMGMRSRCVFVQMATYSFQLQECETTNSSLCFMIRTIFEKLKEEVQASSVFIEGLSSLPVLLFWQSVLQRCFAIWMSFGSPSSWSHYSITEWTRS